MPSLTLKEKIGRDMKTALKNKEGDRLKALRFLMAAIKNKEIELRPGSVNGEQVLSVLKKQIKQIKESIEHYKNSSAHADRLKEEEKNLSVLQSYLPEAPSIEELKKQLEDVILDLKPQSIKDMGKVMKVFVSKTGGAVDGKLLSEMVRDRLNSLYTHPV